MAAIQLNFTLRTSANCKTVHLLGSWDNYAGQLPLSRDPSKSGGWKGTFRFQGATLRQGSRYWYYYIIDGYHVSHDPAHESTTEPTTGRQLNILDVPYGQRSAATAPQPRRAHAGKSPPPSSRRLTHYRGNSMDVPHGRALSPSKIASPRPVRPNQTQYIAEADYDRLAAQFASTRLASSPSLSESDSDIDSNMSSNVPSLTSRSSSNSSRTSASSGNCSGRSSDSSSPRSVSSSSSCCTCERYGITRSGNRIKLDCGGSRCGYSDGGSSCGSGSDSDGELRRARAAQGRRGGIVVRR